MPRGCNLRRNKLQITTRRSSRIVLPYEDHRLDGEDNYQSGAITVREDL
jgi:hypothetical protein